MLAPTQNNAQSYIVNKLLTHKTYEHITTDTVGAKGSEGTAQ
jgi:hypothetical protein